MSTEEEVTALYSYSAQYWDELSFKKGDKIKVLEKPEESWWKGELDGKIGLFPNNYVSFKDKANTDEEKRQQHINELITTEETFVSDILIVNELPSLKIYEDYCTSQRKIGTLLQELSENNKEYNTLIKLCQSDPRAQRLSLSSFLIKPMQRITKYPLLIQKILEYTPDKHADRPYLEKSLLKAENLCRQVNELIREKESFELLEWLQSHILSDEITTEPLIFNSLTHDGVPRKILHYGSLSKTFSKKELVAFLTNDFLLLTQPTIPFEEHFSFEKHHNAFLKIYKKILLLNKLTVLGNTWNSTGRDFQLEYNRTVLFLTATSSNEKNLWLNKLIQEKNKLKEWETEKFISQKPVAEKKRPIGMLKLKILSARNLYFSGPHFGNEVFCEVRVGNQEISTHPASMTNYNILSWQALLRFLIKDLKEDVLHLRMKKKATFSPDTLLGSSKLPIVDVIKLIQIPGVIRPIKKVLKLENVPSGEVTLLLDIHLFKYYSSSTDCC